MKQDWICKNEEETARAAEELADNLVYPAIICLHGNMGAGKTAFSRAFIRTILDEPELVVPSPTFTFLQTYDDEAIWHFDLYRLEETNDLYELGWEEALTAKLCLIEWPERLGALKPERGINITITVLENDARHIIVDRW